MYNVARRPILNRVNVSMHHAHALTPRSCSGGRATYRDRYIPRSGPTYRKGPHFPDVLSLVSDPLCVHTTVMSELSNLKALR